MHIHRNLINLIQLDNKMAAQTRTLAEWLYLGTVNQIQGGQKFAFTYCFNGHTFSEVRLVGIEDSDHVRMEAVAPTKTSS